MTSPATSTRPRTAPTRRAARAQARGDRTRQAVIDETIRCIREEGFSAASANHIAERAGVTWGVVQYHFGDRDGLLIAVVDHGYAMLRAAITNVDVPTGPLRRRVQAIVDAAWEAFSHPTSMAALEICVATRVDRAPELHEHLLDLGRRLTRLGRRLGVGSRADRPAAIGDLLWASLRGLVLAQMVVREPIDTRRERAALVEVLTAYLDGRERHP